MILDTLGNAARYKALHRGFAGAFEFLEKTDLRALAEGRHPIDGDRMFAMMVRSRRKGKAGYVLEAHRRYIDIQFSLSGMDTIGWRSLRDCRKLKQAFDGKVDYLLYADKPATWFDLPPGSFAIFFPGDAHAPMCGTGNLCKVVVKVAVKWR